MSAGADDCTAQTMDTYLRAAQAGLGLHFGEGIANHPAQAVTAAFLLVEIERAGASREGFRSVCEAIGELQGAVSELAVVIAGLNA